MSLFGWNIHIYTFILVYLAIGLFFGCFASRLNYNPSNHHDSELNDSWAAAGMVTFLWPAAFVLGVSYLLWRRVLRTMWMPPAARMVEHERRQRKINERKEREKEARRAALKEQMMNRAADHELRKQELEMRQQEVMLKRQELALESQLRDERRLAIESGDHELLKAYEDEFSENGSAPKTRRTIRKRTPAKHTDK